MQNPLLNISEETVKENEKPMTDEEATPLDWFIIDVFAKLILGDAYTKKHLKQ